MAGLTSCATYHPHAGDKVKMRTLRKSRVYTYMGNGMVEKDGIVYYGAKKLKKYEK